MISPSFSEGAAWSGQEAAAAAPRLGFVGTLKALLGLSRAIIAVFVVAQAGLAAVFALQGIPSPEVIVLGAVACLTGAYSLIAYNDLLDVELDRRRMQEERSFTGFDLGSAFARHPVAQGLISYRAGVLWVLGLAAVSMFFSYQLQPWLPLVLVGVAVFVTLYSKLSTVSPLKTVAVAIAVTLGGVAGWLAVAPPDWTVFPLYVLWTFLWEIGGRNVPNDFGDLEEDGRLGIKTIPVVYGPRAGAVVSMVFLLFTVLVSIPMMIAAGYAWSIGAAVVALGVFLLLIPGSWLLRNPEPQVSMRLFNRSGAYPGAVLLVLALGSVL